MSLPICRETDSMGEWKSPDPVNRESRHDRTITDRL